MKRRYKDYPPNVPRKLIRLYRRCLENGATTAKVLGVNNAHLSKLFKYGIEPKDEAIRTKLFLKKIKVRKLKAERKQRPPDPVWMKEWKHLPTDERQKIIKQYIGWKHGDQSKNNQ